MKTGLLVRFTVEVTRRAAYPNLRRRSETMLIEADLIVGHTYSAKKRRRQGNGHNDRHIGEVHPHRVLYCGPNYPVTGSYWVSKAAFLAWADADITEGVTS